MSIVLVLVLEWFDFLRATNSCKCKDTLAVLMHAMACALSGIGLNWVILLMKSCVSLL